MENTTHPIIVVFYLDRELMQNEQIMSHFSSSVDEMINIKKLNMVAFFMPTDGEEKIDCINPVQIEPVEMEKINTILEDLKKNFDITK